LVDSADPSIYMRLSLMRPRAGQSAEVGEILNKLVSFYSEQSGYIEGYTLVAQDPSSEVGRLTLWKSERDAENVANTQHVLSLRADLMRFVEGGSHVEKSFQADGTRAAPATP
jgi:heme-degrading monooxygenase HmoA